MCCQFSCDCSCSYHCHKCHAPLPHARVYAVPPSSCGLYLQRFARVVLLRMRAIVRAEHVIKGGVLSFARRQAARHNRKVEWFKRRIAVRRIENAWYREQAFRARVMVCAAPLLHCTVTEKHETCSQCCHLSDVLLWCRTMMKLMFSQTIVRTIVVMRLMCLRCRNGREKCWQTVWFGPDNGWRSVWNE